MTEQLPLPEAPAPRQVVWHLDERTKQVGRRGVSRARAALAEASQRAAARETERLSRRDAELRRRAESARTAAQRSGRAA